MRILSVKVVIYYTWALPGAVYDQKHYFGLCLILKAKPKMDYSFGPITSQNNISNETFFKGRNLVTDHKRTTIKNFLLNIKYFWINFVHRRSISCFSKVVFPKKLKNQKNIYNQLWNRYQNWTLMFRSRYQNPVSIVHQPTAVLAYLFYTTSNVV